MSNDNKDDGEKSGLFNQIIPAVVIALAAGGTAPWWIQSIQSFFKPPPPKSSISLVGSWMGSPDCTLVLYKDDGKEVEGNCDNSGYKHKINGIYSNSNNIKTTISRIELSNNCDTNAEGYIKIIDSNKLIFGQNGWNGCGARTDSITLTFYRSQ